MTYPVSVFWVISRLIRLSSLTNSFVYTEIIRVWKKRINLILYKMVVCAWKTSVIKMRVIVKLT